MDVGLRATTPDFAVETWKALPESQRKIGVLNQQLATLGYGPVAKTSLYRWLGDKPAKIAKQVIKRATQVEQIQSAQVASYGNLDLSGIPQEIVEALGVRVLLIAKGEGHDRLEHAIVLVANAIAEEAPQIAKQLLMAETETVDEDGVRTITRPAEAAKQAIQAIAVCAKSLHDVTASRTLPSLAYRNYGEGDRLMGEGNKFNAEAETTRLAARADNAKVISPGDGMGFDDSDREDEAVGLLRDLEGQK